MTDEAIRKMIADLDERINDLVATLMRANAMRARLAAQLRDYKIKTE